MVGRRKKELRKEGDAVEPTLLSLPLSLSLLFHRCD